MYFFGEAERISVSLSIFSREAEITVGSASVFFFVTETERISGFPCVLFFEKLKNSRVPLLSFLEELKVS